MVKVYSTETCPKCKILKTLLKNNDIEYEEITDIQYMIEHDITSVPYLEIITDDGISILLNFQDSIKYINKLGEN